MESIPFTFLAQFNILAGQRIRGWNCEFNAAMMDVGQVSVLLRLCWAKTKSVTMDYYALARRNTLIASVAISLLIIGYFFFFRPWLAKQDADERAEAARNAKYEATVRCVEANGHPIKQLLLEESRILLAENNCTVSSLKSSHGNSGVLEAGMTACEYKGKQEIISRTIKFCNQWTLCSKPASYNAEFNKCFGVYGPSDDDTDSSDSDGD